MVNQDTLKEKRKPHNPEYQATHSHDRHFPQESVSIYLLLISYVLWIQAMGLLVMKLHPARNTSDSKRLYEISRPVVKVFFHLGGESISISDIA
jgi:hypothetical protein